MYYDLNKHRYILTPEALNDDYGIDLAATLRTSGDSNPDTLPERFLKRVSLIVYNYIYSWAQDKDASEYVFSDPEYRETIKEAMEELAYAWLTSNSDPSVFFTEDIYTNIKVNPAVHTILVDNGLLFRGKYINLPKDWIDTKGEEY